MTEQEFSDMIDAGAEAQALVEAVKPLLANRPPLVVGAALADLLALWLAGHVMVGDKRATKAVREEMLKAHIRAVKTLIPVNYKAMIEPELKRRTH